MIKPDNHIFQGLQLDADPLKHKSEFLVDAQNIRFTTRGEDTELAITNEKGTTLCVESIKGEYVGHAVLNNYIVVFTHASETRDYIYRIECKESNSDGVITSYEIVDLTESIATSFNFKPDHPIECITYYESDLIQKVYWTDGINQPRVINIVKDKLVASRDDTDLHYFNNSVFDFVPELELKESVTVTKEFSTAGSFPAGALQYAITYYNKYGQETNVAWVSPLYYTSFQDRAGSPEETIGNIFKLVFDHVDPNYDYMRVYSIMHTSKDGTPVVKIVSDISLNSYRELGQFNTKAPITTVFLHPSSLTFTVEGESVRLFDLPDTILSEVTVDGLEETSKVDWPILQKVDYWVVDLKKCGDTINNVIKVLSVPEGAALLYIPKQPVQTGYRSTISNNTNYYSYCMFARGGNSTYALTQVEDKIATYYSEIKYYGVPCLDGIRVSLENGNVGYANENVVLLSESGITPTVNSPHPKVSSINKYYVISSEDYPNACIYYVDTTGVWRALSMEMMRTWFPNNTGIIRFYISSGVEIVQGEQLPTYFRIIPAIDTTYYTTYYTTTEAAELAFANGDSEENITKSDRFVIASSEKEFDNIKLYHSTYVPDGLSLSHLNDTRAQLLELGLPTEAFDYNNLLWYTEEIDNYTYEQHFYRPIVDYNRKRIISGRPWANLTRAQYIQQTADEALGTENFKIKKTSTDYQFWVNSKPFIWDIDETKTTEYAYLKKTHFNNNELKNIDFSYPFVGVDLDNKKVSACLSTGIKSLSLDVSYSSEIKEAQSYVLSDGTTFFTPTNTGDAVILYYRVYLDGVTPTLNTSEEISSYLYNTRNNNDLYINGEALNDEEYLKFLSIEPFLKNGLVEQFYDEEGILEGVYDYTTENITGQIDISSDPFFGNTFISQADYPNAVVRVFYSDSTEYAYYDVKFSGEGNNAMIQASQVLVKEPQEFYKAIGEDKFPNNIFPDDFEERYWAVSLSTNRFLKEQILESETNIWGETLPTKYYEIFDLADDGLTKFNDSTDDTTIETPSLDDYNVEVELLDEYEQTTNPITVEDTNTYGETIDPTALLYVGGESITADTITAKDGTMFLGGITIQRPSVETSIQKTIKNNWNKEITQSRRIIYMPYSNSELFYSTLTPYKGITDSSKLVSSYSLDSPRTFKIGEYYRLGIQFQYKTGKWSDPIFLTDYKIDTTSRPSTSFGQGTSGTILGGVNICAEYLPTMSTDIDLTKIPTDYKKVRPVIVIPSEGERVVLGQGVANPTVFSIYNRITNVPYAQASWFFRPAINNVKSFGYAVDNTIANKNDYTKGSYVEYRHYRPLFVGTSRGAELDGISNMVYCYLQNKNLSSTTDIKSASPATDPTDTNLRITDTWLGSLKGNTETLFTIKDIAASADETDDNYTKDIHKEDLTSAYAVDGQIITINTPDIESLGDLDNLYINNIGQITFGSYATSKGHLLLEVASTGISTGSHLGLTDTADDAGKWKKNNNHARAMYSGLSYYDGFVDDSGRDDGVFWSTEYSEGLWMIYPWQKTGSINNDAESRSGATAVLKKKVISNIRYSDGITYFDSAVSYGEGNLSIKVFNQEDDGLVKLNGNNYYGSVNTMTTPPFYKSRLAGAITLETEPSGEITVTPWKNRTSTTVDGNNFCKLIRHWTSDYNTSRFAESSRNRRWYYLNYDGSTTEYRTNDYLGDDSLDITTNQNPIRIKYKSTSHIVVDLGTTMKYYTQSYTDSTYVLTEGLADNNAILNLMDISRTPNVSTLFGGSSEEALQKNKWLVAGDAVDINTDGTTSIVWKWGDTYYQRWDCLKTFPYASDDINQVVDILSFMVESRVNCDGRYDRNRGQTDLSNMSPTNFNLRNSAYDQDNNYFTYQILPEDYYNINHYPITYAWSLQKQVASEVDNWTTVTLANQLDVDGNYGPLRALKVYNDKLLAFQDTGISNILFNSRVQVNASDGVPIQISNNYKVDGTIYISTNVGCKNKWSICTTPEGLYFVDTQSQEFYQMGANGLVNLSKNLLCSSWFKSLNGSIWHTNTDLGTRVFYDNQHSDVYITNGNNESLVYSERLKQFTSKMTYKNLVGIVNVGRESFALSKQYTSLDTLDYMPVRLWKLFDGKYNNLFDTEYAPYYISYISNLEPTADKIFSTINVRADWFNDAAITENHEFFNKFQATNEYQDTDVVNLDNKFVKASTTNDYKQRANRSNLRKKFRVWRVEVPRDKTNKRDRIRNMWTKFTFTHDSKSNTRMELHDLATMYFLNGGY